MTLRKKVFESNNWIQPDCIKKRLIIFSTLVWTLKSNNYKIQNFNYSFSVNRAIIYSEIKHQCVNYFSYSGLLKLVCNFSYYVKMLILSSHWLLRVDHWNQTDLWNKKLFLLWYEVSKIEYLDSQLMSLLIQFEVISIPISCHHLLGHCRSKMIERTNFAFHYFDWSKLLSELCRGVAALVVSVKVRNFMRENLS